MLHSAELARAFVDTAQRYPDTIAIFDSQQSLTYARLLRWATQVAHTLQARGVVTGSRVGLAISRSIESTVGVLGILLAGGVYVPIDPSYPKERQRFIQQDCDAKLTLCSSAAATRALDQSAEDHFPLPMEDLTAAVGTLLPLTPWTDEPLLCLVYTSGSTGRPKGVCVTQTGMYHRFRWGWQTYPFAEGEVVGHRSSLNFLDASTELFSGLLQGTPTAIISHDEATDLHRLPQILVAHGVTRITVVPSVLAALLRIFPELGARLPRLRLWISSGEELSTALLRRFRAAHPQATLLNLYGSTEVSADVTCAAFPPGTPLPTGRVPIGQAIADAELLVLDDSAQPVAPGDSGELYVGGPVLCRGYWQRPEEDRARFVRHPKNPAARLFRTGDRVRLSSDGQLEYLGRTDHQVKVNGIRIELEEIEQNLNAALPSGGTVAAAAVPSPADPESRRLWVFASPQQVGVEQLRQLAIARLPAGMVPSRFVTLAALPLLPNGKVDRREVGRIAQRIEATPRTEQAILSQEEQALADLYSVVLGIFPIYPQDSLAALGGDSLSLAELGAQLRAQGGEAIPLAILRESTVAQVALWQSGRESVPLLGQPLPYDIVPATQVNLRTLIQFATEVFIERDPVCRSMKLEVADLLPYYTALITQYLAQERSLVAVDKATGALLGFSIVADWTTVVPFDNQTASARFALYLDVLLDIFDRYERTQPKPAVGEMLDLALAGADSSIDGSELVAALDSRILARAKAQGYKRAGTLCVHRATAQTARHMGFERKLTIPYDTFERNGQRLLAEAAATHQEAVLYVKDLTD